MKTYCLAPIASRDDAVSILNSVLPGQSNPWVLKDSTGDAIAYFSLVESEPCTGLRTILADVSGRHYNEDEVVLSVLKKFKADLGGEIIYAP
jgi:hypothetical protein